MTLSSQNHFSLQAEQMELVQKAIGYEQASLAKNTWRTYTVLWGKFVEWCEINQLSYLPTSAETISLYLASLAGDKSLSTIDITIVAIEKVHQRNNLSIAGNQDLYRRVRKGIRREHKDKLLVKKAKALNLIDLSIFCRGSDATLREARDRAIITISFFGALRRSEAVGLDIDHLEFTDKGVILNLYQTKTSHEIEPVYLSKTKDPSICPVIALKSWITLSGIKSGPLFRPIDKGENISDKRITGHSVARIMKKHFGKEYSGHSSRRGLVTSVAEKGIPIHKIQQLSRHRSADMALEYIEKAEGFENASAPVLGI